MKKNLIFVLLMFSFTVKSFADQNENLISAGKNMSPRPDVVYFKISYIGGIQVATAKSNYDIWYNFSTLDGLKEVDFTLKNCTVTGYDDNDEVLISEPITLERAMRLVNKKFQKDESNYLKTPECYPNKV